MAEKLDRRVRKTRTQLRAGLARLMERKPIGEITVKELVEEVDINRSTFYLHYTDIYTMLAEIERTLLAEIEQAIATLSEGTDGFSAIEAAFSILEENRDICRALVGPHGDLAFVHRIESVLRAHLLPMLEAHFPSAGEDLRYALAFCLHGSFGLIKTWLLESGEESPGHMAELTRRLVLRSMGSFYQGESTVR